MTKDMEFYLQDLRARRASAAGSEKDAATQHGKNRLTARERLNLLFDPDTFTEIDTLVLPRHESYPGGKGSRLGDGVVTGFGQVNGRRVFAASQDAAVMGGSLGEMHANKIVKAMQMALKYGCRSSLSTTRAGRAFRKASTAWAVTPASSTPTARPRASSRSCRSSWGRARAARSTRPPSPTSYS